ncbi:MAG: 4Fe-4S binding protein [Clostridia bacterium]|nr:4Fe-4S binding protein [Clostridia bacterium]
MKKDLIAERKIWRRILAFGFILLLIASWFFPPLGYFMLFCMLAAMVIGVIKGRYWCDWLCPRGDFYDIILSKLSLQKPVPKFFRSVYLRIFMMMVLMTVLTVKLIPVWGDYYAMGKPFVLVLTVTTIVGIILGVIFNERIWCMFCPIGTMANWLGRGKQLLQISSGCKECGACAKVCRMQIIPQNYKTSGVVTDGDCLKCSYCVKVCPVNALSFDSDNVSDRMSQKRGLES